MVVSAGNIGMFGYTLGSQVHVVDLRGLADPLASRLRLARRERPGHEKMLPDAWVLARFTDPKIGQEETVELRAARDAVETGAVLSLLHAIEEPLTTQRFFRNLTQAWDSTSCGSIRTRPVPKLGPFEIVNRTGFPGECFS